MHSYYTTQSRYSSPGRWKDVFDDIPDSVEGMVKTVQNILIHQFWIVDENNYGISPQSLIDSGRKPNEEINLLTVEDILSKLFSLKEAGLREVRKPEERVVGNCRDFTLLLVSIMRHKGIPARSRSGTATYFAPNHFEDHFVCEYFSDLEKRWIRVDAQLDALMIKKCGIDFCTFDVPHEYFLDAAESIVTSREGHSPDIFGIGDYYGQKYLDYKLFSDLAHMSKMEILPWEGWGIGSRVAAEEFQANDQEVLDQIENYIKAEKIDMASKLFLSNDDFKQPQDYKPFFLELPFFKTN